MDKLTSHGKPFAISRWEVWEAFREVKENQGAPGVDGCSIADFEADLKNNLFKIWNRMSSGTYFPPPVRARDSAKSPDVRSDLGKRASWTYWRVADTNTGCPQLFDHCRSAPSNGMSSTSSRLS
jgi:hypothetical protein